MENVPLCSGDDISGGERTVRVEVVAYIRGEHHILQLQWVPILHIHAQLAKLSRRNPRALKT